MYGLWYIQYEWVRDVYECVGVQEKCVSKCSVKHVP